MSPDENDSESNKSDGGDGEDYHLIESNFMSSEQNKKMHFSAFSRLFHSSNQGKEKTQSILDQYYQDKKVKEQM